MDAKLQAFISYVSGDRRSNDELSEIQRVAIAAFVLAGRSYRDAAYHFNCSYVAVQKTMNRFSTNQTFKSIPRKGRPEKLSKDWKHRWRASKRPAITPEAAAQRLEFAREWLGKEEEIMWGAEAIHNLVGAYSASLSEVDTSSSACCCCDESSTSLALSSPSNSHFDPASASSSSLRVLQPSSSLFSRCDVSNGSRSLIRPARYQERKT
ncbi:hypothetical protein LZ30DRAFT_29077 [Colletotrichum cereale]|nr:hypothetical protein LZ30DRAFT_29077 [Colletotrichum cereale]